jgi:hypothetical protein
MAILRPRNRRILDLSPFKTIRIKDVVSKIGIRDYENILISTLFLS